MNCFILRNQYFFYSKNYVFIESTFQEKLLRIRVLLFDSGSKSEGAKTPGSTERPDQYTSTKLPTQSDQTALQSKARTGP